MGWEKKGRVEEGVKGRITNGEDLSKKSYGNLALQKLPNTYMHIHKER